MKLATLKNGTRDGQLIVVSRDGTRYITSDSAPATIQAALENWSSAESGLREVSDALNADANSGTALDVNALAAPLPRAWQWLDGSVYTSHAELMERLMGKEPTKMERPYMYQGQSDTFYGPTEDVPFLTEEHDIDFEGEFGILTDDVPAGTTAAEAIKHIKLLVQINDWSLRKYAGMEMATGFGWINAKPPCAMAPFAVTPDELGEFWDKEQIQLNLNVKWNGEQFGHAHGGRMAVGFNDLIERAAVTRKLVAGTVIGSGTVSNENYREVGSSCIAERRGIEVMDTGSGATRRQRGVWCHRSKSR